MLNLVIGFLTMMVCLILQAGILVKAIRFYRKHLDVVNTSDSWSTFLVLNIVMLFLVMGNFFQVAIWAMVFQILGEFSDYTTALYHSAVNFATLGYGDIVMSEQHRLLGPLEAINGVIMIGVSTATLMTVMQDAMKRTFVHPDNK